MSKSKSNPPGKQLDFLAQLFGSDKQFITTEAQESEMLPNPLLIAQENNFPLQHYAPTEKGQEYQYSIQDWIAGVGKTSSPRKFWDKLKNRTVNMIATVHLPYRAKNGREYQMEFTNDVGLYHITQRMAADTGIRDKVLRQMAEALGFADKLRIDEDSRAQLAATVSDEQLSDAKYVQSLEAGASPEWAARRAKLVASTLTVRDTIQRNSTEPIIYGRFHDTQYKAITGYNAAGLRKKTGRKDPRNGLGLPAISALDLSNSLIDAAVEASGGVNNEGLESITHETSDPLGEHLERMAKKYGFDRITGKPLLKG